MTSTGQVTWFRLPAASYPAEIILGPDKNLWYTVISYGAVGRMTPSGVVQEFQIPTANSIPGGIAAGPDGNVWFTDLYGSRIDRITPAGQIREFPCSCGYPGDITAGPDGNLWFAVEAVSPGEGSNAIGRITPAGQVTEFPLQGAQSEVGNLTAGPDGNVWFTDVGDNAIGYITPAGQIKEFPLPTAMSDLTGIVAGPDGNLWFTECIIAPAGTSGGCSGSQIGRITPAGQVTEFRLSTANSDPTGITIGPDKNLWFVAQGSNQIGRITSGK